MRLCQPRRKNCSRSRKQAEVELLEFYNTLNGNTRNLEKYPAHRGCKVNGNGFHLIEAIYDFCLVFCTLTYTPCTLAYRIQVHPYRDRLDTEPPGCRRWTVSGLKEPLYEQKRITNGENAIDICMALHTCVSQVESSDCSSTDTSFNKCASVFAGRHMSRKQCLSTFRIISSTC